MSRAPAPSRFILRLRAVPAGADRFGRDPAKRLALALKLLARGMGLVCESVEPAAVGGNKSQGSASRSGK